MSNYQSKKNHRGRNNHQNNNNYYQIQCFTCHDNVTVNATSTDKPRQPLSNILDTYGAIRTYGHIEIIHR